jgi:tetratricopeptide (TPR) repeat protein
LKKQQIILISGGVVLLFVLYFFGRTVPKHEAMPAAAMQQPDSILNIKTILEASKQKLTPSQLTVISGLEGAVVRGDVKDQQVKVYRQMAAFWRDSAHLLLPYSYYTAEAAKLENSEKSLTFAAQFFLDNLRKQSEPSLKAWMGLQGKELFEKALALNPNNDSAKIGLGSCYLFGNISENPMQGIMLIREVTQKDSTNMYAQFMLGMGALISGQLDRAAERLEKVAKHEPGNLEAILALADVYERKEDHPNAIRWYESGKKLVDNPEFRNEIDKRISLLKQ